MRRWHLSSDRTVRGIPQPACGERRSRNISPRRKMVNCARCRRLQSAKKVAEDAIRAEIRRRESKTRQRKKGR